MLLLTTCPLFLRWYPGDHNPDLFLQPARTLLTPFTSWVLNCPSDSIVHCSEEVRDMIRHLNVILVRPIDWETSNISSQEFYDDYCKLVSQWISFLPIITRTESSSEVSDRTTITRFIVQDLYNFTLHPSVLNFMTTIPNLIPTLLKMTDIQQDETQLNIYRCLGKIMVEDDIKTMAHPDKIAMIYIKFLSNSIDDVKKKDRFHSLLESLINWVQHDQLKVYLLDQNILPLLIRCTMETKFDSIKAQKPALEILLALSFKNDASSSLKQNQQLMNYIRNLSKNTISTKASLQRAAEGLLWKLEKETEAVAKPTSTNTHQFDIMISYSHSDKQICHRIHEQLVKDGFRVWIDREQMHGATMIAMAEAIENSNIILICMSDTYKQSVYCQSEAHYAFERRRRLIPLIMKSHYKPDGWLGIIVSGKLYVDFVKLQFQSAYDRLKVEINQCHQQKTNPSTIIPKEKDPQKTSAIVAPSAEQYSIVKLPHCINQWTNDHVNSFLVSIGLKDTLHILCSRMDGHRLIHLYEMCMMNRESMFQSLKIELVEGHHKLLPINDYVTFLHEIKKYVPLTYVPLKTVQPERISTAVCNVM
ncbi:unnamed protein product [Adineta steineri]|uniref:TIR domain-containing protein n=2 Tax=Adineta steineri TaxID=433720 RepID=A0A819II11_9BILA|nr:unnamed protein product [Adineta steineri]